MRFIIALLAVTFFLNAPTILAQGNSGTPVNVWSDPGAKYWIVGNTRLNDNFRLVSTRREGRSGQTYAIRLVDCSIPEFAYIGDARTFALAKMQAEKKVMQGLHTIGVASVLPESVSGIIVYKACNLVNPARKYSAAQIPSKTIPPDETMEQRVERLEATITALTAELTRLSRFIAQYVVENLGQEDQ